MTVEDEVRSGLADLVEQLRPMPDPLGRLLARSRRQRLLRRASVAFASLLAVSAAALVPALGSGGPPAPRSGERYWSMRLAEGPPRGSVATSDFTAEVTRLITDELRAGTQDPALTGWLVKPPERRVRVLFAEDVEQRRVVIVSLVPRTGDRFAGTILAWIESPRGAAPATVAQAVAARDRPAGTSYGTSGAVTFVNLRLDLRSPTGTDAHIGLAPPGCSIATAASTAVTDWRPEPTDSYVVRTATTAHPEWWRVTCNGVVRYLTPAPYSSDPDLAGSVAVTDEDVQHALAGAPGSADPTLAKDVMQSVAYTGGYALGAKPDIVWLGRVTGFGNGADAVVAAAPLTDGRWIGVVRIAPDRLDRGQNRPGAEFITTANPLNPSTLLAIALELEYTTTLVVVAPSDAVTIRALDHDRLLAQAPVTQRGTVLTLSTGATNAALRVEAVDANGVLIATAPVAESEITIGYANWD